MTKTLNQWAQELQALAEAKGFRENIADPTGYEAVAVYVANFHGEASELWEAARANRLREPCDKAAKMREHGIESLSCLEEEIADMVIRPLDIGNVFGTDIDAAFSHEYVTRRVAELRLPTTTDILVAPRPGAENGRRLRRIGSRDRGEDVPRRSTYHRLRSVGEEHLRDAGGHEVSHARGSAALAS